jgi:DNA-binding NarL/FixJ family response regulator
MTAATDDTRVLIAGSCPLVQVGLQRVLAVEPCVQIVGVAGGCFETVESGRQEQPDIALIDASLPPRGGIAACREVLDACRYVRVLVLSWTDNDALLVNSWLAGATGFLPMQMSKKELIFAVRAVVQGSVVFTAAQLTRIRSWERSAIHLETLSRREKEALELVLEGYSNRELSRALSITENTVEKHVGSILRKFNMASRAALISFCYRQGLYGSEEGLIEQLPAEGC